MTHFSLAQHRIGYRNQRLNSQFSAAFSSAQSHSTSGTRHVLLRLRRFSPLSYVNDYWATVQFIRQYKHCEHHAPTNNQDSLTRSICEKAGYDQHNFPHMTPLSHRHRNSHEDIPKPYTTGAQMPCRTGGGSGGGRTPGGGSGGGRSCPKLTDDGQEWWSIAKT